MSSLKRLGQTHLLIYNFAQAIGWGLCAYHLARSYLETKSFKSAYDAGIPYARMFQAAAILDVVHCIAGLVPSSPAMALMQWMGRSNVLFMVLCVIPEVQPTQASILLLIVWSLSEVIRYPWYALTQLQSCPYILTWLRYTAFIPLYPTGVICEMLILWHALPHLEARKLYQISMPNSINFAFQYHTFIKVVLVLYLPLWWNLYSSLLRQRSRKLGKGDNKAKQE